ncbi:hypothetical protein LG634_20055 [Streptomyces bambusae]|uniref:hypothetical protein n=1 Tax=Streptomyces bambusae TaxID=1550616 RepID=UPI001CFD2AF9|nr:hypothetical protein [Streptomyces bambusae]MCB5167123.1 hypothetical protein [Streptomyces bambusae]
MPRPTTPRSDHPRPRPRLRTVRRAAAAVTALLAGLVLAAGPAPASVRPGLAPFPFNSSTSGVNGAVTAIGTDCPTGELDLTKRWTASSPLPAGQFSDLPGTMAADMQFLTRVGGGAALRGDDSRVTLTNSRGTVVLALSSGNCTAPTLAFGGGTVAGSGTWTVVPDATATHAYRQATGAGTFTINAGASPATGNPWSLSLNGTLTALEPALAVTHRAFWGGPGPYLTRTLSVEYRIRNNGPGDAFNVKLVDAAVTGSGATRLGPVPQTVGTIPAGRTAGVVVRYRVCGIAVLGCRFTANVQTSYTDAFGVAATADFPRTVFVPTAPVP